MSDTTEKVLANFVSDLPILKAFVSFKTYGFEKSSSDSLHGSKRNFFSEIVIFF